MKKRVLSILLVAAMLLANLPVGVLPTVVAATASPSGAHYNVVLDADGLDAADTCAPADAVTKVTTPAWSGNAYAWDMSKSGDLTLNFPADGYNDESALVFWVDTTALSANTDIIIRMSDGANTVTVSPDASEALIFTLIEGSEEMTMPVVNASGAVSIAPGFAGWYLLPFEAFDGMLGSGRATSVSFSTSSADTLYLDEIGFAIGDWGVDFPTAVMENTLSANRRATCVAYGHDMADATCTAPKTCSVCGITEGEALGHDWDVKDCAVDRTCLRCGTPEAAKEHSYTGGSCTVAGTCSACGATQPADEVGHDWREANCGTPKTCVNCGETEGEAAGGSHDWYAGTCTVCGDTVYTVAQDFQSATDSTYKNGTVTDAAGFGQGVKFAYHGDLGIGTASTNFTHIKFNTVGQADDDRLVFYYDNSSATSNALLYFAPLSETGAGTTITKGHPVTTVIDGVLTVDNTTLITSNYTMTLPAGTAGWVMLQLDNATYRNWAMWGGIHCPTTKGVAGMAVRLSSSVILDQFGFVPAEKMDLFTAMAVEGNRYLNGYTGADKLCESQQHTWAAATCIAPQTCTVCGWTVGEIAPQSHAWIAAVGCVDGYCSLCDVTNPDDLAPAPHAWADATCVLPQTCSTCGRTEGSALGHTTTTNDRCDVCGVTAKNLYYTTANGEVTITGYSGSDPVLVIPSVINGYPVTVIGNSAFDGETDLTSVTIPDSVTSIGQYAFEGCTGLTAVHISDVAAWCDISFYHSYSNPLYYAENLFLNGEPVIDLIIPEGVTTISSYAFYGCTSITSVTIPDSVTSIGWYAFYGCTGLTEIIIPDSVTWIGNYAFSGCTGLTEVTIGEGVTSMGDYAFSSCTSLKTVKYYAKSLEYPDYVDSGDYCWEKTLWDFFLNCPVEALYIGETVETIDWDFFCNFTDTLNAVYISDVAAWCEIPFYDYYYHGHDDNYNCYDGYANNNPMYYADKLYLNEELLTDLVIPEGVTSIDNRFHGCTSIVSLTIPESMINIDGGAFAGCTGLTKVYYNAVDCTSMGYYYDENNGYGETRPVFTDCNALTTVVIGEKVQRIPDYAFCGCTSLASVIIPDCVTSIGSSAFDDCTGLTEVTIGDGVTSIGYSAFRSCTSLTSVIIPNNVITIEGSAFSNCTGLTEVTIGEGVTSIGDYAFQNCTSLTEVTIGDSVTSIGYCAFQNCTSLTSVTIPDSVTSIDYYAFSDCTSLSTVQLGAGLTIINTRLFSGCSSLIDIVIPESVVQIDGAAFDNCTSLKTVTIPLTVRNIEQNAFRGCTALESVYYGGTEADWAAMEIATGNTPLHNATLYDCQDQCDHAWQEATCFQVATCSLCGLTRGGTLAHDWRQLSCTEPIVCAICGTTEEGVLGHDWREATCTAPVTCAVCGLTEGEALGHQWSEATCEQPSACTVCGVTNGTALGHVWSKATCTAPAACGVCGKTQGEALGHTYTAAITAPTCTEAGHTTYTCTLCGDTYVAEPTDALGHTWRSATCATPKTCTVCGLTEGKALGHQWSEATCEQPSACTVCGVTNGTALGHVWSKATCTAPAVCGVCGKTQGEALGHSYSATMTAPTCTAVGYTTYTCAACGDTYDGDVVDALGHTWGDPTCEADRVCAVCGAADAGTALGHRYAEGFCTVCGGLDPAMAWLNISSAICTGGNTVELTFTIENTVPLKSLALHNFTFDTDKLEIVSGAWSDLGSVIAHWDSKMQTAVITFAGNTDVNKAVFTLTLRAKEGVDFCQVPVSCSVVAKTLVGEDENAIPMKVTAGTVQIGLAGDMNRDDVISADDAIYLLYHTMLPELYPIGTRNGDVDNNGRVNSNDAIYLLYYALLPDQYPLT